MAQKWKIVWGEANELQCESLILPPQYTNSQRCNTIANLIEGTVPQFNVDGLAELAKVIPAIILVIGSDQGKNIQRFVNWLRASFRQHNAALEASGAHTYSHARIQT